MAEARFKQGDKIATATLNEQQVKARKSRNIAIALCLVAFVGIFYVATVVKFGPEIMANRGFTE